MKRCGVVIAVVLLAAGTAQAQVMCSLGPGVNQYNPFLDEPPTYRASIELDEIYQVLCPYGCGTYVLVSNPSTPNASAITFGMGQTKISYQDSWMDMIDRRYGGGATYGILAHEFGHHIDLHTTPQWMNTSWSRELKADARGRVARWPGAAWAPTKLRTRSVLSQRSRPRLIPPGRNGNGRSGWASATAASLDFSVRRDEGAVPQRVRIPPGNCRSSR